MTPLCELAIKYGCDKTPSIRHSYTPYYHELLRRQEIKAVLEIGIYKGASLRMWRDYFPEAVIIGIDKDPGCMITEKGIFTFLSDQTDVDNLRARFSWMTFDLIIDDGSHNHEDQWVSLFALYDFLRLGGLYVIEDVQRPGELSARIPMPHHIQCFGPLPPDNDDCLIVIEKGMHVQR